MAYGLKYYENFSSFRGVEGQVKFYRKDYTGDARRIQFAGNGPKIQQKFNGWENPIILQSASFTILNDSSTAAGWYDYQDLMTSEEREYQIIIDASYDGVETRLFDGFIDSKPTSQRYMTGGTFNLTASNYVSKLNNTHPDLIDTIQKQAPINIIDKCLQLTGKDASILVNNTLDPSEGTLSSGKSCLNITGIDTENFHKNNLDRDGGKTIIEKILRAYDSIYSYWNKEHRIERYGDLWSEDSSKGFIAYAADGSYGYYDSGDNVERDSSIYVLPILGPEDNYEFVNDNQSVTITPGLNKYELKLDTKKYLNLTVNDFSNITANSFVSSAQSPDKRGWVCYEIDDGPPNGWQFPGYKWDVLSPSIGYAHYKTGSFAQPIPGNSYQTISNSIYRYGAPQYWSGGVYQYNDKNRAGLSTRVDVTIEDENTSIKVNWKFAPIAMNGGAKAWDYKCNFFVRVPFGGRYIAYRQGDGESYWEYTTTWSDASSYIELKGDDIDEGTGVGELSVSIPIGDVSGWTLGTGDFEIIFGVMGEDIRQYDEEDYRPYSSYPIYAYYGDFVISTTGNPQDNIRGGILNNNTIEKKQVNISLFDIENLNYRSGIYTGYDYGTRTSYWTDGEASNYYPIADWIIANKIQLYSTNRQTIKSDMEFGGFLPPLSLWVDNVDPSTRKYILTSSDYYPGIDLYSNCHWDEYSDEIANINYE